MIEQIDYLKFLGYRNLLRFIQRFVFVIVDEEDAWQMMSLGQRTTIIKTHDFKLERVPVEKEESRFTFPVTFWIRFAKEVPHLRMLFQRENFPFVDALLMSRQGVSVNSCATR